MDRGRELDLHKLGHQYLVGIDEAGRGPLAGPVVAAAVGLPLEVDIAMVRDSKTLSAKRREVLFTEIKNLGVVGIGQATPREIDEVNILQATFLAMRRAIENLPSAPDYCLIDGNQPIPDLGVPQETIVKGDASCFLIAAASIIAKVTRDRLMQQLEDTYPGYGFAKHKGYPTKEHRAALARLGPCRIHRHSFQGVKIGKVVEL